MNTRTNENEAAMSLCIMSHNKCQPPLPSPFILQKVDGRSVQESKSVLISHTVSPPPLPPFILQKADDARSAPVQTSDKVKAVSPSPPPLSSSTVKKLDGRSVPGSKAPTVKGCISVDEMARLMRVYGPLKSIRIRNKGIQNKPVKVLSIKRKFYRWFPDFDARFEQMEEGWYVPKIGHEAEILYRAAMREEDEMSLISLRASKRRENMMKKKLGRAV